MEILSIIASILAIVLGYFKYSQEKRIANQKKADQAKKDLENAEKTGNASDLIDAFMRMRK